MRHSSVEMGSYACFVGELVSYPVENGMWKETWASNYFWSVASREKGANAYFVIELIPVLPSPHTREGWMIRVEGNVRLMDSHSYKHFHPHRIQSLLIIRFRTENWCNTFSLVSSQKRRYIHNINVSRVSGWWGRGWAGRRAGISGRNM